jgi:glycolate oxidase
MTASDFKTLHEIVKASRENLDDTYWDYLVGGSDTETTLRRNRYAIDKLGILPKVLNDVSDVDTSGSLLGQKLDFPVMLAPIGSLQVLHESGGAGAAVSAAEAGVIAIASSVCEPGIEEIAAASDAAKIYQIYVRGDDEWLDAIIERVIASGYVGFCFTVDTSVVSRRERDIAKRVVPTSQAAAAGDLTMQAKLSWKTIERVKKKFDIPIILKGISRIDDALKALDHGVEVIYVSNHGGRQMDQSVGSIAVLPEIARAVDGRAEIAVDGGFYRGTDILKAIALGADAVGLGRLEGWALSAGGPPVLTRCLALLRREMQMAMAMSGIRRLEEIDASFIVETDAVTASDVFSAFPLLEEDY